MISRVINGKVNQSKPTAVGCHLCCPASRVSFDLPEKIGKSKITGDSAPRVHLHAPRPSVDYFGYPKKINLIIVLLHIITKKTRILLAFSCE